MFCTAEAAGWTLSLLPEARYKTSFYSMSGGDGQTLSMVGIPARFEDSKLRRVAAKECSPRRKPWVLYRFEVKPRRGERAHQSQRYCSSTVILFFFKNARNSS